MATGLVSVHQQTHQTIEFIDYFSQWRFRVTLCKWFLTSLAAGSNPVFPCGDYTLRNINLSPDDVIISRVCLACFVLTDRQYLQGFRGQTGELLRQPPDRLSGMWWKRTHYYDELALGF